MFLFHLWLAALLFPFPGSKERWEAALHCLARNTCPMGPTMPSYRQEEGFSRQDTPPSQFKSLFYCHRPNLVKHLLCYSTWHKFVEGRTAKVLPQKKWYINAWKSRYRYNLQMQFVQTFCIQSSYIHCTQRRTPSSQAPNWCEWYPGS